MLNRPLRCAAGLAALAVVLVCGGRASADNFPGGIYTTLYDGTTVNQNLYQDKHDVYLAGGPQNQNGQGLPDGLYYFQVTNPNGAALLSSDLAIYRELQVVNGVVAGVGGTGNHSNGLTNPSNGATGVQLFPFDDTTNNGNEYKVWLVPTWVATIDPDGYHLTFSESKTDNFKVEVPAVPEPAAFVLAGIGLVGLAPWGLRRLRAK